MNLTFCVESPTTSLALVTLKGKILSVVDTEDLKESIKNATNLGVKEYVFDCSQLTDINSSGINFIIRTLTNCRIQQGELALCGLTGNVKKVLETAKIDQLFSVYSSVSEAINHFN
jgi:anti-sigma B factor antagonist